LPPLVTSWEIETLKSQLAEAARGEAFLLQGGDCSENLDECSSDAIVCQLKVLIQMSLVLMYGSHKRVIRVGRIAGQYAKPRSAATETRDGVTLPVYRGDIINRSAFSAADRTPDPELLLRGYERAALSLNFIRALTAGGFADLHHPEYWDLGFPDHSRRARQYQELVNSIASTLRFMDIIAGSAIAETRSVQVFTSHEGLHLPYEQAQTRQVPRREGWFNLATHFPWIGYRTQQLDGAHVEYFRGIANPIAVKVGPATTPDHLMRLAELLNPDNQPGRLTLIHRFGVDAIDAGLPPLIDAAQRGGLNVGWCCDPMHGNTLALSGDVKTRRFDDIVAELGRAFEIHRAAGSILAGVHLELTGANVTECLGGVSGVSEQDLPRAYRSAVDPRLNYEQSMEIAFLLAERIADGHSPAARAATGSRTPPS
jgi:3-deoxy-7-phosphoheptulonate synthase